LVFVANPYTNTNEGKLCRLLGQRQGRSVFGFPSVSKLLRGALPVGATLAAWCWLFAFTLFPCGLHQAISAVLWFAVLGSAFGICLVRCLAVMNFVLRGIEADVGKEHADTFRHVQHLNLRAEFVIATALRDSASNQNPTAAAGKRSTTNFFKK
jgi:hypothetical protein